MARPAITSKPGAPCATHKYSPRLTRPISQENDMTQDEKSPQPSHTTPDDEAKKRAEMERKRRELEERLKQEQYQRDDM